MLPPSPTTDVILISDENTPPNGKAPAENTNEQDADAACDDIMRLPHYTEGVRCDGKIYRDDHKRRVKLDKVGRPYTVGEDGWRVGRASTRPPGVDPEVWAYIRPTLKKEGKSYEEFVQEAREVTEQKAAPAQEQNVSSEVEEKFSVLEIFAGSARATSACQQAGITVGPNIDLITGYDLSSPLGRWYYKVNQMLYSWRHRALVGVHCQMCVRKQNDLSDAGLLSQS